MILWRRVLSLESRLLEDFLIIIFTLFEFQMEKISPLKNSWDDLLPDWLGCVGSDSTKFIGGLLSVDSLLLGIWQFNWKTHKCHILDLVIKVVVLPDGQLRYFSKFQAEQKLNLLPVHKKHFFCKILWQDDAI